MNHEQEAEKGHHHFVRHPRLGDPRYAGAVVEKDSRMLG